MADFFLNLRIQVLNLGFLNSLEFQGACKVSEVFHKSFGVL